ncbi:hypothetical protein AB8A21_30595, partial [Streptomyces sp. BF23-18]|uniref:hypothetical protein n=1 Tax=Streptomyces sp. BF23-18 TaxID=3240282 RepID=UPI0034E45F20
GHALQRGRGQHAVPGEPPVDLHAVHDELLVLDVRGGGPGAEQDPYGRRYVVLGALGASSPPRSMSTCARSCALSSTPA